MGGTCSAHGGHANDMQYFVMKGRNHAEDPGVEWDDNIKTYLTNVGL